MKGQIFILGAISVIIALFLVMPSIHKDIFLPNSDNSLPKNIASEYNHWIAYASIDSRYDVVDFGNFVNEHYPNLEFFYLFAKDNDLTIVNFFDEDINFEVNGKQVSLEPNKSTQIKFSREIDFSSGLKNFTYEPENRFSGAIFLRLEKGTDKIQLLEIFP